MKNRAFNSFLRSAEPEALGGGSSVPAATAAPEIAAETPVEQPAAETPAKGSGILQRIEAGLSSKMTLLGERDAATARADHAEAALVTERAALATAQGEITALRAQVATLTAERTQIEAMLNTARDNATTVELAAAVTVAGMGFDAAALPAAGEDKNSIEALEQALDKETDPKEICRLNEKLEARKAELKKQG